MPLEITPPIGHRESDALRDALARVGVSELVRPAGYESPWRRVAAREAVDNDPTVRPYARSPRRTRGATSA